MKPKFKIMFDTHSYISLDIIPFLSFESEKLITI